MKVVATARKPQAGEDPFKVLAPKMPQPVVRKSRVKIVIYTMHHFRQREMSSSVADKCSIATLVKEIRIRTVVVLPHRSLCLDGSAYASLIFVKPASTAER